MAGIKKTAAVCGWSGSYSQLGWVNLSVQYHDFEIAANSSGE